MHSVWWTARRTTSNKEAHQSHAEEMQHLIDRLPWIIPASEIEIYRKTHVTPASASSCQNLSTPHQRMTCPCSHTDQPQIPKSHLCKSVQLCFQHKDQFRNIYRKQHNWSLKNSLTQQKWCEVKSWQPLLLITFLTKYLLYSICCQFIFCIQKIWMISGSGFEFPPENNSAVANGNSHRKLTRQTNFTSASERMVASIQLQNISVVCNYWLLQIFTIL